MRNAESRRTDAENHNSRTEKPKENIVPGKKIEPVQEPTPAKPERIASPESGEGLR